MEEVFPNHHSKSDDLVLLTVLAHPDDESFGPGGTLAYYAKRGVRVHLLCATRGEVGTVSEDFLEDHDSIAELRAEKELRCAAEILGLKEVHFLGYRDSGMPGSPDNEHPHALVAAPVEEVAEKITHYIRRLRPQVVITHDPIGGYKHPDHIAVHNATVKAFHAASDPQSYPSDLPPHSPQKLYFHTLSIPLIRPIIRLMPIFGINPRAFGRNKDIDLEDLFSEEPFPIHAVINYRPVADLKEAASACHASQLQSGPGQFKILSWIFRFIGNKDQYMRAYPPFIGQRREKDLFNGLDLMV